MFSFFLFFSSFFFDYCFTIVFNLSFLLFFIVLLFSIFFFFFFFLFQSSKQTPTPEKNRREIHVVNMTNFLLKIRFLCLGGQGRKGLGMAHSRETPFSCFHFSFSFLPKTYFCFFFFVLALVSEFNSEGFLRSRCSMEMWCPDDTERGSWDWVGPLRGRGA